MSSTQQLDNEYGPLVYFQGVWESQSGDDVAPGDDRGVENNKYREQMIFERIGQVNNHEQIMFGVKYSTKAWRIGAADSFHEDTGYWLWDAVNKQLMKCFCVPRGINAIAGGTVESQAKQFTLQAQLGSATYGICSNPFLDAEFKTEKFEIKITIHSETSFSYEQDTQIKMKNHDKIFHHTDKNTLVKRT